MRYISIKSEKFNHNLIFKDYFKQKDGKNAFSILH